MGKDFDSNVTLHPMASMDRCLSKLYKKFDEKELLKCVRLAIENNLSPQRLEEYLDDISDQDIVLEHDLQEILDILLEVIKKNTPDDHDELLDEDAKDFIEQHSSLTPDKENRFEYFVAGDQLYPLLPDAVKPLADDVFHSIDRYLRSFFADKSEENKVYDSIFNLLVQHEYRQSKYHNLTIKIVALYLYHKTYKSNNESFFTFKWLVNCLSLFAENKEHISKSDAIEIYESNIEEIIEACQSRYSFLALKIWINAITTIIQDYTTIFTDERCNDLIEIISTITTTLRYESIYDDILLHNLLLCICISEMELNIDEKLLYEELDQYIEDIKDMLEASLGNGELQINRETFARMHDVGFGEIFKNNAAWILPFYSGIYDRTGSALSVFSDSNSIKHYIYCIDKLINIGWLGFAEDLFVAMLLQFPFEIAFSHKNNRNNKIDCGLIHQLRNVIENINASKAHIKKALQYCYKEVHDEDYANSGILMPQCHELLKYLEENRNEEDIQSSSSIIKIIQNKASNSNQDLLSRYFSENDLSRLSDDDLELLKIAMREMELFLRSLKDIVSGNAELDRSFLVVTSFGKFIERTLKDAMQNVYDNIDRATLEQFIDYKYKFNVNEMLKFIRKYPSLPADIKKVVDESGMRLQKDLKLATDLDAYARIHRNKAVHDTYTWKDAVEYINKMMGQDKLLSRYIQSLPSRTEI